MSLRSKNELECLATRLREEMHVTTKDPVRIHQILKEKNILTWFRKLDDNFSGMAIRIQAGDRSRYFMLINTAQSYAKQRFTACHELYHLLYYLLLPEMGLKELTPDKEQGRNKITLATLLKIEQNFGCSRSALLMRLKGLGWITDEVFARYQKDVRKSAIEYGYSTRLYEPTYQTELVGDYNLKARALYDAGLISQAKYFSLLADMGLDFSKELGDGEE